ncbi:MAG: hypothetical protein WCN86_01390 [bacterium]
MKKLSIINICVSLLFLAIAVIVLIDLLGLLDSSVIISQYWPVLLVFIGLFTISPSRAKGNGFSFGIMTLGLIFMLQNLGVFSTQTGKVMLVILLALCGLVVLIFATSKSSDSTKQDKKDLYF